MIQSVAEHGRWIPEELEIGSKQEHDAWMERNGSWAPPHQMLPYEELSREEKDKDRAIVLAAIDYLVGARHDAFALACMHASAPPSLPPARPPPSVDVVLVYHTLFLLLTQPIMLRVHRVSEKKAKFYNDTIWADRSDPPPIDLEYLKNQSNGSAASGDGS